MNSPVTHLEDYDTEQRFKAIVVESERITPEASDAEVRELTLELQQSDFELQLGQSVGVFSPGTKEFGQEHHFRLYSVADLPEAITGRRMSFVGSAGHVFAKVYSLSHSRHPEKKYRRSNSSVPVFQK